MARRATLAVMVVFTVLRATPLAYSTCVPALMVLYRISSCVWPAVSPSDALSSLSTGSSCVSAITSVICTRWPYCSRLADTSVLVMLPCTGVTPSVSGVVVGARRP